MDFVVSRCGPIDQTIQRYLTERPPEGCVIIYVVINNASSKTRLYVGKTVTSGNDRLQKHFVKNNGCRQLCCAIEKYGKAAFQMVVLKLLHDNSRDYVQWWESAFIHDLDTLKSGYNGKDAECGLNEASMKQRIESYKATVNTPESRQKRSEAISAAHARPEVKESMRKKMKQVHNTESAKASHSLASAANWQNQNFLDKWYAERDERSKRRRENAIRDAFPYEPSKAKRVKGRFYRLESGSIARATTSNELSLKVWTKEADEVHPFQANPKLRKAGLLYRVPDGYVCRFDGSNMMVVC